MASRRALTRKVERGEWLRHQYPSGQIPEDEFSPQPYDQLASVLRNMGYEAEATLVEMHKNSDYSLVTQRRWFTSEWWWYNVFGKLIGYGYDPLLVFCLSLCWITVGAVIFQFGYHCDLIRSTKKDSSLSFNAIVYSLESFTPLLKLDQSENWAPDANARSRICAGRFSTTLSGRFFQGYLWFHIILGWLLTTFWIGGLTGLVKS